MGGRGDDDWRMDAEKELAALEAELHERWRNGDDPELNHAGDNKEANADSTDRVDDTD